MKNYAPLSMLDVLLPAGKTSSPTLSSWCAARKKKEALFDLVPQKAILQASAFFDSLLADLNRAQKGAQLHTDGFYPEGTENILISSVDAALAGQNTLLAAESLGYGGVIIGLVRYEASKNCPAL